MKMRKIQHAFGSLAVAMSDRLRSFDVLKTLAMALLVILTSLSLIGLIWFIGKHMGPPRWVQDTEIFIATNHVEGVENVVRQLIRGNSLSRRDINLLLRLDCLPIKCLLLSSSWLDVDSKLNIYMSSSISEKRELYTALNQEEQDAIDVLEGRYAVYILHKVGWFLEYIYSGNVWKDLQNRMRTLLRHGNKAKIPSSKISASPKEVRVVPVARKSVAVDRQMGAADTSPSVAIVCGDDADTATRYDLRNDALRSIARRRDLSADDVVALMGYVASTVCVMRVEREAALKNDVLNLLRNQKLQPEGLADLLLDMVASKQYAPVIIDYCIQHLGAMVGSVSDGLTKARIRETFVAAAKEIGETYSGTALYSLAEMPNKSKPESDELRLLTVAACGESASPVARISAIQLAGERGCRETLPMLRGILAGTRRDAVLDMAVVGSIGLMGDANDVQLLESFRSRGGRRLKPAIAAAVQRIKERGSQ